MILIDMEGKTMTLINNNTGKEKDKLSVIIPIHNGEKYIRNTIKRIQKQNYCNYELILVENGSSDNSWEILKEIRKKNPNIIIFKNDEKGTSLARKKGIALATGKYIIFSDQDDYYLNNNCFAQMIHAIEQEDSDICQFGYYSKICGIRRLHRTVVNETKRITREELLQEEIQGIVSSGKFMLNTNVWSKIYRAEILKEVVSQIEQPLYYCEDMYLNTIAFFNKSIKRISVHPEAYYVWNVGIGSSGADEAAQKLFSEYEFLKPKIIEQAEKNNVREEIKFQIHIETIYFMKAIIENLIDEKIKEDYIIRQIKTYEEMNIVSLAKEYLKNNVKESELYEELKFLISSYTAEEYYDYLIVHKKVDKKNLMKKKFVRFIRKKHMLIAH